MLKHEQYLIALGNNILLYCNTCQVYIYIVLSNKWN